MRRAEPLRGKNPGGPRRGGGDGGEADARVHIITASVESVDGMCGMCGGRIIRVEEAAEAEAEAPLGPGYICHVSRPALGTPVPPSPAAELPPPK